MADIYVENVNIKNLYFGGVNSCEESGQGDEEEESFCQIDPDFMAKTVSVIEEIDLATVQKVFAGAAQFLRSAAKHSGAEGGQDS